MWNYSSLTIHPPPLIILLSWFQIGKCGNVAYCTRSGVRADWSFYLWVNLARALLSNQSTNTKTLFFTLVLSCSGFDVFLHLKTSLRGFLLVCNVFFHKPPVKISLSYLFHVCCLFFTWLVWEQHHVQWKIPGSVATNKAVKCLTFIKNIQMCHVHKCWNTFSRGVFSFGSCLTVAVVRRVQM